MSEKKRILRGNSDFESMINGNGYFVDKTIFLKEFMNSGDHVLVMPRPRRFGKTLNLSMTEYFFDIQKPESKKLFREFKINEEKAFCEEHQNKYPVISISFKNVDGDDWKTCMTEIRDKITNLFRKHKKLLSSDRLESYEKKFVEQIIHEKGKPKDYRSALEKLSHYLNIYFEKKVIILIDEYDAPIISGFNNGYYDEIIKFMKSFLGNALKDNTNLEISLVTGILRIAKESIFPGINNVGVYAITSNYFSDHFGFTEQETIELLKYFGLQNQFQQIKHWYNGYQFGSTQNIYNPWSISSYVNLKDDGFKTYWVNTSSDDLIKKRIIEPDVREDLQKLIMNEHLIKAIEENFVFTEFNTDSELLWTLLTFTGYLTINRHIVDEDYELRIPNNEVKKVFKKFIIKWLNNDVKIKRNLLYDTAGHLVHNHINDFEAGFKKIMGDTFSYFDTGKGESEKVYQSYLLGLLACIGDDYLIKSNRESGEGRYDIMLLPKDKAKFPNGIVIEIKQLEKKEKEDKNGLANRVNNAIDEAFQQIEEKEYYKELVSNDIPNIIKLPIVFVGKNPYVNKLTI